MQDMLKIRLQRIGRKNEAQFRAVLTDSKNSTKSGKFLEILGTYNPKSGVANFKADRVKEWISKGAQPSDTVAMLLKKKGFAGMEKFMAPRDKQRKSSKDAGKEAAPAAA
jgi:small subunit ribosomal protein S16